MQNPAESLLLQHQLQSTPETALTLFGRCMLHMRPKYIV
jgi:hypothetical protein